MRIETSVRGDPSIEEVLAFDQSTNRYFEENITAILSTVIDLDEYPHHTLRFYFVIIQRDKNVGCGDVDLLNSGQLCAVRTAAQRCQTQRVLLLL